MDVQDAHSLSLHAIEKKKKEIRFIWNCGLINRKIRKATDSGAFDVTIEYAVEHYVVRNHIFFESVYKDEGYQVEFKPDYLYIKATKWRMKISW